MTKHKIEYYKIFVVKYYLNNDKGDWYKKTVLELLKKNKQLVNELAFDIKQNILRLILNLNI
jgi:hypothetical protein